mgnify:CR=1 FL=1
MGGAPSSAEGTQHQSSSGCQPLREQRLLGPSGFTRSSELSFGLGTLVSHYASSREEAEAKNDVAGARE